VLSLPQQALVNILGRSNNSFEAAGAAAAQLQH
jgi:hypothetical protein